MNNSHSRTIDLIKGGSVLSIICAHCCSVPDGCDIIPSVFSVIVSNLGTLGVICFFVISGYLFHFKSNGLSLFIKKKTINIILPWFIGATVVYLYVHLRKPPFSFWGWISFTFGYKSYFYYLSVLCLFYLLFYTFAFMRSEKILLVCIATTAICLSTESFYNCITPYLNPFNWIGYFALGVLINRHNNLLNKCINVMFKYGWLLVAGYIIVLVTQAVNRDMGSYWGYPNVVYCWIGASAMVFCGIRLSPLCDSFISKLLVIIGNQSLFFYIWHMPIAGIITNITNRGSLCYLVGLRPIFVLLCCLFLLYVIKRIFRIFQLGKYLFLIGLRG